MSDTYKELIVKKDMGAKQIALRAVCIVPTVFFVLLGLVGGLIPLLLAIAFGVLTYFVWMGTDVEYEYLYVDKELSIDKVMAKSRRKKVTTLEVARMEMLAPEKSYHLDEFRNRDTKKLDYSAGRDLPGMKLYVMYYDGGSRVQLNLTDDFANAVKSIAPRKVFLD